MNILVTGSAGFVGRSLVPFLKKRGHTMIGTDLKPDYFSDRFVQQDLRGGISADLPPVDLVIHLASDVGGFLKNNTDAGQEDYELALLKSVYQFCKTSGCKRILYTSSINVFEQSQHYPHGPLEVANQKTPYARAKKKGEEFIQQHFEQFLILRPTNIFGKIQTSGESNTHGSSHVIPDLLKKIELSETVEVFGDGSQIRNFIHVSDVCRFFERILGSPLKGWYNLRSEIQISIKELVQELVAHRQANRKISYRPEFMTYEPLPICKFALDDVCQTGWKPLITTMADGLTL